MEPIHLIWVGGHERPGRATPLGITDPSTGAIFARCHAASDEDVAEAVAIAHATFQSGIWSRAPPHRRAEVLEKAAELLSAEIPALIAVEVRQTGRAIREMNAQVPSLVRWFRYYAAHLRTEERSVLPTTGKLHNWIDRRPLGVVVQITPFNHPLLIAVKKLAPALAAGNSVILKPSELTPITSLLLGRIMKDAGLPDGVLSVLPGLGTSTGKALVSHPLVRKVDVTGGTAAGRAIGELVGKNLGRYTAELGGKAPLVVFEAADIEAAVNGIAFGSFIATGQTCVAATRILVQEPIFQQVTERLKLKAESIRMRTGSPKNPESMMGPLISERSLGNVESLVNEAIKSGTVRALTGAERMRGPSPLDGFDLSKGYFYPPTILVSADTNFEHVRASRVWKQEIFGPVIVLASFKTEEEAVLLANDSEFGLGAGIWTNDLSQAYRVADRIDSGIVWVNTHHRNDPSSPWGGAKSSSGVGSENGVDAYNEYTTTKSTIINYASVDEMRQDDWFAEDIGNARYG